MKDFEEFRDFLKSKRQHQKIKYPNLLFILTYPDKLKWDYAVEKQAQQSWLLISGGITGAGTAHNWEICYQSEVQHILKVNTYTHAMIISIGMMFNMSKMFDGIAVTPITQFYDFVKSSRYCKAHIISRPDKPAYLHFQHIELNVDMWKTLHCPDLFGRWKKYERSEQNYHDDYTPYWIDIEGLPRIYNFDHKDRSLKSFSYPHKNQEYQNKNWELIRKGKFLILDFRDQYFRDFCSRMQTEETEMFYMVNNESFREIDSNLNFDIIISPTAGYSTEKYVHELNHKGKVIFYDYVRRSLKIKEKIVTMCMPFEDQIKLGKMYNCHMGGVETFYNDTVHSRFQKDYGELDLVKLQENMVEKCDIEYVYMNLIEPDWQYLRKTFKNKKVLFNASNIFSYHISHAKYTFEELFYSFEKLNNILSEECEFHCFIGTRPTKVWTKLP